MRIDINTYVHFNINRLRLIVINDYFVNKKQ